MTAFRLSVFALSLCLAFSAWGGDAPDARERDSEAQSTQTAQTQAPLIEEIRVRTSAREAESRDYLSGYTRLDGDALGGIRPTHPHEVFVRVPGLWISRGSGQEHLTAMRSAVLTGAGACGGMLYLEDGIPIRPQGFCNVNNLFETTLELADSVEVLRGPAVASFRGNPLYGAINSASLESASARWIELEAGSDARRVLQASGDATLGTHAISAAARILATDSFRDQVGHRQQKVKLVDRFSRGDWRSLTSLALTNLDQQTGGYVLGGNAYKSSVLRRTNPNPEAWREAWSARLTSHWQRPFGAVSSLHLAPYVRATRMEFLQHFLPGQPSEANGHTSLGLLGHWTRLTGTAETALEAHVEWADVWLEETQDGPTRGSAFLVETRPPGRHYDFDVRILQASLSGRVVQPVGERLQIQAGVRAAHLGYAYRNQWLTGNTRDDGRPCGFGGCLYSRPASRDDAFTNFAGTLGLHYSVHESAELTIGAGSGFRAPQATELYRLQRGQLVADLDSERRDSLEVGLRWRTGRGQLATSLYAARSRHLIFRDSRGMNVSDGKTRSLGVEFEASLDAGMIGAFELVASWARHEYDFNRRIGRGEVIESGKDLDTAPRFMGSVRWKKVAANGLTSELEVTGLGEYWMDAGNTHQYGGHWLANWRLSWRARDGLEVFFRVTNLLDRDYAHRADFAFGNQRYFPGLPRQLALGMRLGLS